MEWRALFRQNVLNSAEDYIESNSVRDLSIEEERITGSVAGLEVFQVDIELADNQVSEMTCSCSYAKAGSNCKHMAAILLAWERENSTSTVAAQSDVIDEGVGMQESLDSSETEKLLIGEDNQQIVNLTGKDLQLSCEIDDILTYAIVHNGANIVRAIIIKNVSEADIDNLLVKISSDNGLTEDFSFGIEKIKPNEERHFKNLSITINAGYLASLTERSICQLTVSVFNDDKLLITEAVSVTVLAFDQWPGLQYTPELLAAFSMPNHPVVASMIQLASKYLENWTQDPSLAGYQFEDLNRIKNMAAAAYAAIQQKNITYAEPPSSFETFGQRIRLADTVLEQHLGTCMDMTLLYIACLEAMGLNPLMIMMKGHIFAGVWLIDESFSDIVMDDPSQLEKRMSKGIHELMVIECTAMCAGKVKSFDEAVAQAEKKVSNYSDFAFVIDVKRARSMGIRPLPVRVKTVSGFEVQHAERKERDITKAPTAVGETFDLSDSSEKVTVTKQTQWERKLLDLSLRNMLINMRMTKAVVPLLSSDISTLEDALTEGEEFLVLPRPSDMTISGDGGVPAESLGVLGPFVDYIALESKHKKLHSLYTEKELTGCLTKMYRSAKTSMEENGASTLYLALGLLRWFEGKKNTSARYAPIILVPIDIVRKSASKGYAMRMRDEDAQINITLLEFLKQSFDIQILGLNPPPLDEHGLDIPKIFALIRQAIINLPMWNVVEAGFIGNFSFSQFVMWNDIHSKSDFLQKNKIVHSLMDGSVNWDCTIPESVNTDEAYLPITADSSQLRAINMAAAGISFVLHGPPGTGKSQTITAMIANALAKGRTVLFVAEKLAALEVVQKRLAVLGIQDFCLELHSSKTTKKAVLDQLKRGLEIGSGGLKTDYDKKIQDIRKMRADLDAYANALHERRAFGKSLRQLVDLYEMIPDVGKDIRFACSYAASLTESELDQQMYCLEQLVAAGKSIGHPHNHPLAAVQKTEYSQRLKFDLEAVVHAYSVALEQFRQVVSAFVNQMELDIPVAGAEWKNICNYASSVIALAEIPEFLRHSDDVDRAFAVPETYLERQEIFTLKRESFQSQWNENFLRMDMNSLRIKYDEANKKFFGKGKALAALTSEIQAYASFTIEMDKIPALLTDIMFYQQEMQEVETAKGVLSYEWKELLRDYPSISTLQDYKANVKRQLQAMRQYSEQGRKLEEPGNLKSCIHTARELLKFREAVEKTEAEVQELLDLRFDDYNNNWMDSRLRLCSCILEHSSDIKSWIVYKQFVVECKERGLTPVCDAYEAGTPHKDVIIIYLRAIYRAIILSVIESEPVLNGFTGGGFNEKIVQFKKLDQEFMELTKEEMFYKLTHQLPLSSDSVETSRELNILRRAISSNGRGLSNRALFEQIPHILPLLCPCMLMSPISVAQYLRAENDLFDIVIFDEASQLPTCKAVGVLARGKNAVIVGDPNQMPPTSFFAGNTVDEDNLDIEDLDSILDDCLALGMPQSYLHWHYRSRHESLIAFSNQEFYENSMLTFPSVNDRQKRVSLVKTEGFFDRGRGRINEGEAKAIVDEIKRRYKNPELAGQTVGVVTFNISQQTFIEDLLLEEYQKDAAFDNWANIGGETMFVKNLENVQGDERDVILFSIAFGPDADGKLSLNFGPLNKDGGWKRLNVAVSRARSEMVVFTTMTADMIDLKRTKSKGVEALKNFLEFAEKGRLQGEYLEIRVKKDQGIMEHICQQVTNAGFKYQKSVGHSKFKVDIAVINPFNEEEYLLGIMLDGESYNQSSNTKDREVAQNSVLNGLGWELHRIWTMDWWDNREKEISRLMATLEERKQEAYQRLQDQSAENVTDYDFTGEADREVVNIPDENTLQVLGVPSPIIETEEMMKYEQEEEQKSSICIDTGFLSKMPVVENADVMVASQKNESVAVILQAGQEEMKYQAVDYVTANIEVLDMSTADYVKKESLGLITQKMQHIIDAEAPITYDRLVRKTLRAFNIARSSTQTLEATDKALKKTLSKMNKQAGIKVYWRKDQEPDRYRVYRIDSDLSDKRTVDEISQQELKNAVCITLKEKGALDKDSLFKETIRTMGFARSGVALLTAVERGLKYGRKTEEILQDEEKRFMVNDRNGSGTCAGSDQANVW